MERKQKRFFGLLGLFVLAAMTVVAAMMPSPGASAVGTTSMTDTLEVRVVSNTPAIEISSDVDNGKTSFPAFVIDIDYAYVEKVDIYQTYIGADGKPQEKVKIATYDELGNKIGSITDEQFTLYEYGKYIITAEATASDGSATVPEDYITFEYLPVIASISENTTTGDYAVAIESHGDDVDLAEVYLDGTLVGTLDKDNLDKPVVFSMADKPSGTYTITVVAKDAEGNVLYIPLTLTIDYEAIEVPDAGTPDTGGLFKNANISKEDYLTTGVIVFFILGIVAFGVVSRGSKKNSKK